MRTGTSLVAVIAATSFLLGGCATIMGGKHQDVAITTSPEGARCTIQREGLSEPVAEVVTPATVNLRRNKHDLKVTCAKPGLPAATRVVPSKTNPWWIWGNLLLVGGPLGIVIDAITKANNKYPKQVEIALPPSGNQPQGSVGGDR
ncbi:MAG: hypothetical protein KatS3mg119_0032 [Rhodothalassiaceae bacterium]|nr:MAG: hypothetical protein KatS3mg119_0032 [Rhodothalassiaceae bacterium]